MAGAGAVSDARERTRQSVWLHARRMWQAELVAGSSGNASSRIDGEPLLAVTPTSIEYDVLEPGQISIVDMDGKSVDGPRPSSELPTHLAIYHARPDVGGIVHTHSPYVTSLSMLRKPLPPVIDEMLVWLGGGVEVADYAFTGTEELGANAVRALGDRAAVILSNHGNVCVGRDLAEALHAAIVVETAARAWVQALSAGTPVVLPDDVIARGREMYEKRRGY
jgi:L-fuculose-phosphate aldolase